jgi:predicted component of type VI protein secretion system
LRIPAEHDLRAFDIYLCVVGLVGGSLPMDKAVALLKLASATDLPFLQETHTAGIELTAVPRPPVGVPARSDASFFRVRTRGNWWASVQKNSELALHHPPPVELSAVELYLIPVPGGS